MADSMIEALREELDKAIDSAMDLLARAADTFEERPPDATWFREYYLLTGDHMILTEEGWESGESKQAYTDHLLEGETIGDVILDEVNVPRN